MNAPTQESDRIDCLDVIRGVAVCGLVPMNILDFGPGEDLSFSPYGLSGIEVWGWQFLMIFGSAKFMSLFSMLFGAGIILGTRKADALGQPIAGRFATRLGWLWFFGMLHAYLLWYGDILVCYAITGFVLFWCRKWSPKSMVIAGTVMLAIISLLLLLGAVVLDLVDFGDESFDESLRTEAATQMEAMKGSWTEQLPNRAFTALMAQLFGIPFFLFWTSGGLMFYGMALMKSGFFENRWEARTYRKAAWVGLIGGTLLSGIGYGAGFREFTDFATTLYWFQLGYWGTFLLAIGYATLLVAWSNRTSFGAAKKWIGSVGRMAFSNYIGQSVILGLIFYGHGLGWKGELSFGGVLAIVPLVWIFQILFSHLWLKKFRYGPLEWIWRCLTYMKMLPIVR